MLRSKRVFAVLLALVMVLSLLPFPAVRAAEQADAVSKDVAVFLPYYGNRYDDLFSDAYVTAGQAIAAYTGGTCTVYRAQEVTIDAIAHAVETCDVVIVNTHGGTDDPFYATQHQIENANSAYLTILNGEGITEEDCASVQGEHGYYKHAFHGVYEAFEGEEYNFDIYWIDGTAIANHITQPVKCRIFWCACCQGMLTDGIARPLREAGVEVVFGYSESVSAIADEKYGPAFFSRMCAGDTVSEAAAFAEDRYPVNHDSDAYAIYVTPEDPYPGVENVYSVQIPHSSMRLKPTYAVTAVTNDPALGSVSVNNTTITATPADISCAHRGYRVLSGTADVQWDGKYYQVTPQSDCTVEIVFEPKTPASVRFVTPDGVRCESIPSYVGDPVVLPEPEGTPDADGQDYRFYAWATAPTADTGVRPDCLFAGSEVTLDGDETYYALYTYQTDDPSLVTAGRFRRLDSEPADWTGEILLTIGGTRVLKATDNVAGAVSVPSSVKTLAEAGIEADGDLLTGVSGDYVYLIEPYADGVYTIRMKNSSTPHYLSFSSENKLATISSPTKRAQWTLSWADGAPVIRNVYDASAKLVCSDNPNYTNISCYNTGTAGHMPVTLYVDASEQVRYTTALHSHELREISRTEPTCTSEGLSVLACATCGKRFETVLPTAPHTYVTEVTEPTCAHEGYTAYTCTVCGYHFFSDFAEALDHDYKDTVTAPKCTEQGYTTHTCSRCGDSYIDSYVNALGHSWDAGTAASDLTCTEAGVVTFTCTRCGETKTESVPALGHDYKDAVTQPTCTERGYTTHTCSRCGDRYVDSYVDALGHDYKDIVTRPTCTEKGYTTHTCSRCGDRYVDSYVDALGHKWDAGKVTKEPTETAEGVKTFTCTVCGATRTEAIPKLTPKPANPFKDVKDGAYYYDPVLWALNHIPQITDGVSDDAFAPDKTCTRGQVVTFLWRANGCPEPTKTDNPFKDVKSGDYFYKAVLWAVEKGVTDGTSATTFSPNAGCTRGQVVTFLWRADGRPAASGANPFTDVKTSDYFYQPVLWAGKAGITDGVSADKFAPDKTCTRGQIVTFLYRDKS